MKTKGHFHCNGERHFNKSCLLAELDWHPCVSFSGRKKSTFRIPVGTWIRIECKTRLCDVQPILHLATESSFISDVLSVKMMLF